ncbi:MAG: hypothetical protein N2652_02845 [Kiritimatiellae bacterium]|nr:hypothetical protein [Kiritimatiellia bacterium]
MLCAMCLGGPSARARHDRRVPGAMVLGLAGFAALWGALYLLGRLLLAIPAEIHERAEGAAGASEVDR